MANLWKQFRDLLPNDPLQVGSVIAASDTEVTVEKADGSRLKVRGSDYAIGSQVYFRAGAIEGEAPDLPVIHIEI
jgi:hypothetical protein